MKKIRYAHLAPGTTFADPGTHTDALGVDHLNCGMTAAKATRAHRDGRTITVQSIEVIERYRNVRGVAVEFLLSDGRTVRASGNQNAFVAEVAR